jgi:hypothetical protein
MSKKTITISQKNEILLKSILPILNGSYITDSYKQIFFYADSVVSLKEYINNNKINYNFTLSMMQYLTQQQQYLEERGYSFYTFSLNHIWVIDDQYIISTNDTIKIGPKNILTFYKPFLKGDFCSKEIFLAEMLPFKIHYKQTYTSFIVLAIYCLFQIDINILVNSLSSIKEILIPIINTKLYWFLLRCIEEEERHLIFI